MKIMINHIPGGEEDKNNRTEFAENERMFYHRVEKRTLRSQKTSDGRRNKNVVKTFDEFVDIEACLIEFEGEVDDIEWMCKSK
jgi:hypothetical protein